MLSLSRQKIESKPLVPCPTWVGELWTAKQRQMHRLHYTVSYRASFKPELPDFFIRYFLLDRGITNARVLDPFGGRGTSVLQANLLGFSGVHNDLNPVSLFLARSRQKIPLLRALISRVNSLSLDEDHSISKKDRARFSPFFHSRTLKEILNFRELLLKGHKNEDAELSYIGLTLLSRLHGHSDGFLSAYSFPQISILPSAQKKNNLRLGQKPKYREVKSRLIRKLKNDLGHGVPDIFYKASQKNYYTQHSADALSSLPSHSIDLIVTSPPFLNKVDYQTDNWMRAWFLGLEEELRNISLTMTPSLVAWCDFMEAVMCEMGRVLKKKAHAVIEVGEVSIGWKKQNLEENLLERLPLKVVGGVLQAKEIFINRQNFTKLSNCWSVTNNSKGTNTNRCLVLQKA